MDETRINRNEQQQEERVVGEEFIKRAREALQNYKTGKSTDDDRIIENNRWYRMRHTMRYTSLNLSTAKDPMPTTAWLFSSIANKHADAMDNFPESVFLPRSRDDEVTATQLSPVMSAIKDECGYQSVYSRKWWDKLVSGIGITGIFWDNQKNSGNGGVVIERINPLNLYWQPNIDDLEKSPYVFQLENIDKEVLVSEYPSLKEETVKLQNDIVKKHDSDERSFEENEVTVVHCWYKKSGKLHYCKFTGDTVLYSSENEGLDSYYIHGQYPYHIDALYPVEDSLFGLGYIDIFKSCQMYIDKLEQVMLKNAIVNAQPRAMISEKSGINKEEFTDVTKPLVHADNLDERSYQPINMSQLSSATFSMLQDKITELKETSANRDFSQGSTASGVTSGAAIAALQEAGSKVSRDMIKHSYEVEKRQDAQIIHLLRQFMTMPEMYRIIGEDKRAEYIEFSNMQLSATEQEIGGEKFEKLPIFDIQIKAQKKSPFSTMEENDRMLTMYKLGMFSPEMSDSALLCLSSMTFDGKDELMQKIKKNGTLYDMVNQMNARIQELEAMLYNTSETEPAAVDMPSQPQAGTQSSVMADGLKGGYAARDAMARKAADSAQGQASV